MPATLAKSGGLFRAMIIALFGMAQAQDMAFAVHRGSMALAVPARRGPAGQPVQRRQPAPPPLAEALRIIAEWPRFKGLFGRR